ncbi:uncharacterized protein LOC117893772 [Drosophila subobscura]|uniref:uncharacterized protein LOC117893772 n=1 Tax=Drosophila subobscura TaxID=7241 RepID=UPI00155B3866|nr:uncharacterized protein LOC117893772 [Drosophila subobscura]
MKYLNWLLSLCCTLLRFVCKWLDPGCMALATLNMLFLVVWLDYHFRLYGCDLLYWRDELTHCPAEYLLMWILVTASIHVLGYVVDVAVCRALLRHNKPQIHYEERYRRFVLLRLVQQLEHALVVRSLSANGSQLLLKNMYEAKRLINEAVNVFRSSVKVLLWPNRTDLHEDPLVLYHINEEELQELNACGYSLGDVTAQDVENENLNLLLNPFSY